MAELSFVVGNCEFSFVCPRTWDGLQETGNPTVRFCAECRNEVYLTLSREQFEENRRLRRCVAVPIPASGRGEDTLLGLPSYREAYDNG